MLVCHVSQLQRRAQVAADISETATAADTLDAGIAIAVLVDEPASASERLDTFVGDFMVEAATAADTIGAGLVYAAGVSEEATAADTLSVIEPVSGTVEEVAAAGAITDATVSAAVLGRSAMVPGVFINPSALRQANANGVMVNL